MQRSNFTESTHLSCGKVADANGANPALLVKFAHYGGCFFNGNDGVGPVDLVKVNVISAEAAQGAFEFLAEPRWGGVCVDAMLVPFKAGLGGDVDAVTLTTLTDGFADDLLCTAAAVDGSGVYQVDAVFERGETGGDGIFFRDLAPFTAADGPGAQADARNLCVVQRELFHSKQITMPWSRKMRLSKEDVCRKFLGGHFLRIIRRHWRCWVWVVQNCLRIRWGCRLGCSCIACVICCLRILMEH